MTFGFDIDGTITAHPVEMGAIMKALVDAGHQVIVITGALSRMPIPVEERQRQLAELCSHILQLTHYHDIIVCEAETLEGVARLKGKVCGERKVNMIFEDEEDFVRWIRALSVQTACVLVRP